MANKNLTKAKKAKNDEFYTQYIDIQKEIEAYLEYDKNTFKKKVVYCNCDDPFESNFFKYFVLNFNRLGLKQLITTSYKPSPVANTQLGLFGDDKTLVKAKGRPKVNANKFIINEVKDMDGDGEFNLKDIAKQLKANKNNEWIPLEGDGDFRSDESIELLKKSDIVVTNPPFSLFRKGIFEYILGGGIDSKLLDIRVFDEATKKSVYKTQTEKAEKEGKSNCPLCAIGHEVNKEKIWSLSEMDADHVSAWSKGGKSDIKNCQMLCKTHNRAKGNR